MRGEAPRIPVVTLDPPWWRCENGCEFRCGENKPPQCPICHSTQIKMVPEVGDGCYCTHHPDDPTHGADCYDYAKFTTTTTPPSTPAKAAAEEIVGPLPHINDDYQSSVTNGKG